MTKEEMTAKLNREDLSGIGVKVSYADGHQDYFFYEDFDGPGSGMNRAALQLAHDVKRGTATSFSFVEHQNGVEVEKEPVGIIEYPYGPGDSGVLIFYDPEKYVKEFKDALEDFGPMGGFRATTLTRDPKLRKAIDDERYNFYDEENPWRLEDYQKRGQEQEPEPELEEEEPEP